MKAEHHERATHSRRDRGRPAAGQERTGQNAGASKDRGGAAI